MTHPIVEGMTEAVTMAKLMRENEELRRDRDTAWNDAIDACKSDVKEWGHLWSDEYYGYEMMGEIISDLEALKR